MDALYIRQSGQSVRRVERQCRFSSVREVKDGVECVKREVSYTGLYFLSTLYFFAFLVIMNRFKTARLDGMLMPLCSLMYDATVLLTEP